MKRSIHLCLKVIFAVIFLSLYNSIYSQTYINDDIEASCTYNSSTNTWTYINTAHWGLSGSPYVLDGTIDVSVDLTIDPGVIIKFKEGAYLRIATTSVNTNCETDGTAEGVVTAIGTYAAPIIFTSYKDDTHGGDTNGDGDASSPAFGDWEYVAVFFNATGHFDHCQFYYGGGHTTYGTLALKGRKALSLYGSGSITNCHFEEHGHSYSASFGRRVCVGVAVGSDFTISNLTFGPNDYVGIGLMSGGNSGAHTLPRYPDYPYLINGYSDIDIGPNQEISFEPGSIIKSERSGIDIEGVLNANGTMAQPVIMTSMKDDTHGGDTNNDGNASSPAKADWSNITVLIGGTANFSHTEMTYAGRGSSAFWDGMAMHIYGNANLSDCHFEQNGNTTFTDLINVGIALGSNVILSNISFGAQDYDGIGLIRGGPGGNFTLPSLGYPYIIDNYTWRINANQNVTIPAATIFKFAGGSIDVDGSFLAAGTSSQPIIFTSIKDDSKGGDTNRDGAQSSPAKKNWDKFIVSAGATTDLDHCEFYYAGGSNSSYWDGMALYYYGQGSASNCHFEEIGNSTFADHLSVGVSISSDPTLSNLSFGPNEYEGIALIPSSVAGSFTLPDFDYPYLIGKYTLTIEDDQTVTVPPGSIFKMEQSRINVEGGFIAAADPANPIIFTSIADDNFWGDTNQDGTTHQPYTGDWTKMTLYGNSTVNLEQCRFLYGGSANNYSKEPALYVASNAVIHNCSFFENFVPIAIHLATTPDIDNLELRNNIYDGIGIGHGTYSSNGNFDLFKRTDYPYMIYRDVVTGQNMNLNINPGCQFKILDNTQLTFQGGINAIGDIDSPIIFTSIKDDDVFGDTNNDGESTLPAKGDWHHITVDPTTTGGNFKHCIFNYGGNPSNHLSGAFRINGTCDVSLCEIEHNIVGVSIGNTAVTLDSCSFESNIKGVVNNTANAIVKNSFFKNNDAYDAINETNTDLIAPNNQWKATDLQETLDYLSGATTNFSSIYDNQDEAALGNIIIDPVLIPRTISTVTPGSAIISQDNILISLFGYEFETGANIFLCKDDGSVIIPSYQTVVDDFNANAMIDLMNVEPGIYDVCLVNPSGDTLDLKNSFRIIDLPPQPFGQWIPFEATRGDAFAGIVNVPSGLSDLHVLIKKSNRLGYANTWTGSVTINKDFEDVDVVTVDDHRYGMSVTDFDTHIKNPEAGEYYFEIETQNNLGAGEYMFTDQLPELTLGQWTTGEILRPYGFDWTYVDVPPGQSELHLRTEGYGNWSTLEVYYEHIHDSATKYNIRDRGFKIEGKIQNPPAGRYYLRYMDSAVLRANGNNYADSDVQRRDYLIQASTTAIGSPPDTDLDIKGINVDTIGQGYVTFEIHGEGFDVSDVITLSNSTSIIQPINQLLNREKTRFTVKYDLYNASLGTYDVNISNSMSTSTLSQSMVVEPYELIELETKIIGRTDVRVGRWNPYVIEVFNESNTNAVGAPIFISFTGTPEIRMDSSFHKTRQLYQDSILNNSIDWSLYPELSRWEDVSFYIDNVDTITGDTSRLMPLLIFDIPAKEKISIELEVFYNSSLAENYNITVAAFPNYEDPNYSSSSLIESKAHTKKAQSSSSSTSTGVSCGISAFSFAANFMGFNGNCLKSLGLDAFAGSTSFGSTIYGFKEDVENNEFSNSSKVGVAGAFGDVALTIFSGGTCAASLAGAATPAGRALAIAGALNDAPALFVNCFVPFFGWLFGSSTPEDKYGLLGAEKIDTFTQANRQNYIQEQDIFSYKIDYWNKEDATAPAVEVFIRDTIDQNFDLTTFKFTEVGFLRWTQPVDGQYINVNIDMRPDFDLIVNIEGTLDPVSREVYWVHRALDPETNDLPYDPREGFLPPIDTAWYNLGWVKYTIEPLDNLPDGTVFENRAHVNFDGVGPWGKAPPYGPWINTYDLEIPSSEVTVVELDDTGTSVLNLEWNGDDNQGVGIRNYTIYYQENGGPFEPFLVDTLTGSGEFVAELGSSYCFYSVATDKVGNFEEEPSIPDTCITIDICDFPNVLLLDLSNLSDGEYIATDTIVTTGVSNLEDSISMYAGRNIHLIQGLDVQLGVEFLAAIEANDCSTNSVYFPPDQRGMSIDKKMINPDKLELHHQYNSETGLLYVSYYLPHQKEISLHAFDKKSNAHYKVFNQAVKDKGWHEFVLPVQDLGNSISHLFLKTDMNKMEKKIKFSRRSD